MIETYPTWTKQPIEKLIVSENVGLFGLYFSQLLWVVFKSVLFL